MEYRVARSVVWPARLWITLSNGPHLLRSSVQQRSTFLLIVTTVTN